VNELAPYFEQRQPAYARLLDEVQALMDGDAAFAKRLADGWRGREFVAIYDQPLLLIASVREAVLLEGQGHPLWAALRDEDPQVAAVTRDAVAAAFERERSWRNLRERYVQTNETSRAVVWLWPATLLGSRPFTLVDCGCSAGLNLVADQLPSLWNVDIVRTPNITHRLGLDARPIDVRDEESVRWLHACVWAGDADRLARFQLAVAAARKSPPPLEALDALDFAGRIAKLDGFVLAYQSVFRDYLDAPKKREYLERMAKSPALWIELETIDPSNREYACAITAHWQGETFVLGRCGYHPTDVKPDETQVRALAGRL
jgi:hypothetical protein